MSFKTVRGRSPLVGHGFPQTFPVALDAVAYEGAVLYTNDGDLQYSDGSEWITIRAPLIERPEGIPAVNEFDAATLLASDYISLYQLEQTGAQFQLHTANDFTGSVLLDVTVNGNPVKSLSLLGRDLTPGATYYWRVRYFGELDAESRWSAPLAQTFPGEVAKPAAIAPTTDIEAISLRSTPFLSIYNRAHYRSQYLIHPTSSSMPDDGNLINYTTGVPSTSLNLTSIPGQPFTAGQTVYWQVRYQDASFIWSQYSNVVSHSFPPFVSTPTILAPTTAIEAAKLRASAYVSAFSLAHLQTTIMCHPTSSSFPNDGNLFTKTINGATTEALLADTPYAAEQTIYWKVKYGALNGATLVESAYSAFASHTFAPVTVKPVQIAPVTLADQLNLTVSAFSSNYGRGQSSVNFAAFADENMVTSRFTITVPGLTTNSTTLMGYGLSSGDNVWWRARYRDVGGFYGPWSDLVLRIYPALVKKPVPVVPTTDAGRAILTADAYQSVRAATHTATQFQASITSPSALLSSPAVDVTLGAVTAWSLRNSYSPTQVTGFVPGATVYWRVRYKDSFNDWSDWSDVASQTFPPYIAIPTHVSPAEGGASTEGTVFTISAMVSNFSVAYGSVTEWQFYDNPLGPNLGSTPLLASTTSTNTITAPAISKV